MSVAQLIRLGSVPAAVQEAEDAYKVVIVEVRTFCQAAKTSGLESPRTGSPDTRTAALSNSNSAAAAAAASASATSPAAGRGPFLAAARSPFPCAQRRRVARAPRPRPEDERQLRRHPRRQRQRTQHAFAAADSQHQRAPLAPHGHGRASGKQLAPRRRSPTAGSSYNVLDDLDSLLDKQSPRAPPTAYVSATGQDIDLEVCEDDDEEMIRLKEQMAALKRMKEETLAEEEHFLEREREELKSEVDARYDSEFDLLRREWSQSVCFTCSKKPRANDPDTLKAVERVWHKRCWQCFHCKKPSRSAHHLAPTGRACTASVTTSSSSAAQCAATSLTRRRMRTPTKALPPRLLRQVS